MRSDPSGVIAPPGDLRSQGPRGTFTASGFEERQNKHQGIKYMDGLRTCISVGGGGGGGGGVWMAGACESRNRDVS